MKKAKLRLVSSSLPTALFFCFLSACSGGGSDSTTPPNPMPNPGPPPTSNGNTVIVGGSVLTVDINNTVAQAIAYDAQGTIIAVGSENDVVAAAGDGAQSIDISGNQIVPGFHDVHLHAVEAGINQSRCLLSEFASLNQYANEIADCSVAQANGWFIGAGVSMPDLLDQTERPIDFLDQQISNRPALILDNLGHGAWANTLAMAEVGYDTLQGDPAGGLISRDAFGDPNGVVFESAQQSLRTAALPANSTNLEGNYQALLQSLQTLAANGVTSVSDAGGYWTRGHHQAWQRAEQEQRLTVRASNAFYVFPERDINQQIEDINALKLDDPGSRLRFDQVKLYVDGIISQGTAATLAPYDQAVGITDAGTAGFEYFPEADLFEYARRFDSLGFSLHFHATGDRGARLALNAIEAAQISNGNNSNRHRITHLFMLDQADVPRFAQLGVVADVQMAVSATSTASIQFYRTLIGNRADRVIPARSLLNANASVTLSSDWDADQLSPLAKIATAVQRQTEGVPDVVTALRLMTINAAELLRHADTVGSLEVGKQADFVILDTDLLNTAIENISGARVLATVVQGDVVYDPGNRFTP